MKILIVFLIAIFSVTANNNIEAGIIKKAAKVYIAVKTVKAVKKIYLSVKKYPQSAKHIIDAQKAGAPKILTVDRAGAAQRRKIALQGKKIKPNKDRDEYPMAMTKEGGNGASVKAIDKSDNRGAGACIGAQCRDVANGEKIHVIVTDK